MPSLFMFSILRSNMSRSSLLKKSILMYRRTPSGPKFSIILIATLVHSFVISDRQALGTFSRSKLDFKGDSLQPKYSISSSYSSPEEFWSSLGAVGGVRFLKLKYLDQKAVEMPVLDSPQLSSLMSELYKVEGGLVPLEIGLAGAISCCLLQYCLRSWLIVKVLTSLE